MLRGIAAALVIAAAAAVTAGCGGGGNTSGALRLDPVSAAATKSQDAGAARVRLNMTVRGPGHAVRIRGVGVTDGTSVEMSLKLRSLLGQMEPQLQHSTIKEIALEEDGDYVVYLRIPFLSSQLPGGMPWIKLDLSTLGKSAGVDLGKLMSGSELQPNDVLSMLEAEGANVTAVGPANVDGGAARQYRVTIDTAKALRSEGLQDSPLLSEIPAQLKTITYNVWIGKDGLVRRVAFDVPVKHGPQAAMTMDLYDYGTHVSIAAPPSSEVFDATQLAQQGIGSTH